MGACAGDGSDLYGAWRGGERVRIVDEKIAYVEGVRRGGIDEHGSGVC